MAGRLHSRQGLQSGPGAVGESPSLLLDCSPEEWMYKPLAHITVIIISSWPSSADSQTASQIKSFSLELDVLFLCMWQ